MSDKTCNECNGSGVGPANCDTQKEFEDSGFNYEPLECQHCNGTGIEP